MSVETGTISKQVTLKYFRSPQTVIGRFIARRNLRSAALWAVVFGAYVASKAIGYVAAYPNEVARQKATELVTSNLGIEILLGPARHIQSVPSVVAWNTLGVMVIFGSIWSLLLATKTFRGEEETGRWELLLAGQTTARRAVASGLAGLGACLGLFYAVIAAAFIAVGRAHGVGFGIGSALFFALAGVAAAAIFLTVGALASQLWPTRGRAASVSAASFGAAFLLRAIGDLTGAHWLLDLTPLGWIEKLQPLSGGQPIWLLPIIGSIAALGALTIFLAGRRDLDRGILADKDTAEPHTALLGSPFAAALRLTRTNSLSWLIAIGLSATLFGLLTHSVTQAFGASAGATQVLNHLARQPQLASATAFLGVVFFLQMVLVMAYAASAIVAIRRDEAEGYLDNFLVRPVGRMRWLGGRIGLTTAVVGLAGLVTGGALWLGIANQHLGVSFGTLLLASANALVPAVFVIGVGGLALGLRPRLTSLVTYGVIAWSFLLEMVSSGINLNHLILDTSILHHIALAPAGNPNWAANAIIVAIGLTLGLIGAAGFNTRDLAGT